VRLITPMVSVSSQGVIGDTADEKSTRTNLKPPQAIS